MSIEGLSSERQFSLLILSLEDPNTCRKRPSRKDQTLNAREVVVPFGGRNHALLMTRSRQKTVIRVEEVWGKMTRRYWNINLEEMMEAGVHFGHGTRKWNPRMAPYISAKRKGIHIINLTRTARFLSEACDLVFDAGLNCRYKK